MLNTPRLVVRLLKRDLGFVWNAGISRPRCSVSSGTVDHAVDHTKDMSRPVGLEASMAKPEIDELDGFKFVAFERADEMDYYVKQTAQQRRPKHRNASLKKTAAGVMKANNGALPAASRAKPKASSKVVKGATKGKKKSILWRHKKRLRKNDKRVVFDKIQDFVFVSAFTLEDFDNFEQEITEQVSPLDGPIKRKSTSPSPILPTTGKKPKKSISNPTEFGKTPNRGGMGTSNSRPAKPAGKNLTTRPGNFPAKISGNIGRKHSGKSAPRHSGKIPPRYSGKIASPLSKSGLDRLKRLNPPVLDGCYVKSAAHTTTVSKHGDSLPKKKRRRFPHMQIDNPIQGGTIYSSSDSDGSTIIISDSEENIYLDVCTIDNDSSSAQFIKNSIQNPEEKQDGVDPFTVKKPTHGHDSKGKLKRRKKCKMCCANPCRIVEAKKVSPLWGSLFPSYNVSCVTTCKLHPPGDIIVSPSSAREGFIDTCIQTTASDIKMHQNFAQRFPHRAIAVTSRRPRVLGASESKPKLLKEYAKRPKSKSEHHRTSEKKRRGQLHDSFAELRRVINTSQATPDNERASKQWILEHAIKLIPSLNSEDILLTAMKKTLEVKNAKLKKRWKELSGKDFDQSVVKKTPSDGQRKLMNLYKKYRHNVVQERFSVPKTKLARGFQEENQARTFKIHNVVEESFSVPRIKVARGFQEENQARTFKIKPSQPSPPRSVRKFVHFNSDGTRVMTTSNTRPVTLGLSNMKKPSEAAESRFNQTTSVPTTASKPHQLTSEPLQATPSYMRSQAVGANNPSQTTPLKITNQPTSVSVSSQSVPIALNNQNQSDQPTTSATLNIPGRGITLKIPRTALGMDMVSRILALKKPRQVTTVSCLPGQIVKLGQASNLEDLAKQGSVTAISKPTQWTSAGKFTLQSPIVNRVPQVEDLGAVVEVGECNGNLEDKNNTIVLLDVAETEDKQASVGQEQRTLSRIPASSSINVTLKSVGSITSNKIFNKKPVPSKSPTTVQTYNEAATVKTTVPESGGFNQQVETTSPTETLVGQVPKISDTLLAETFEGGEDAAEANVNEPGLCIISNVFSLSDAKSDKTYQNKHTNDHVLNDTQKLLQHIPDVSISTKCDNPDNDESKETHVNKLAMHDHNYFSYQFFLPKK